MITKPPINVSPFGVPTDYGRGAQAVPPAGAGFVAQNASPLTPGTSAPREGATPLVPSQMTGATQGSQGVSNTPYDVNRLPYSQLVGAYEQNTPELRTLHAAMLGGSAG